jgi:hypothetical protein
VPTVQVGEGLEGGLVLADAVERDGPAETLRAVDLIRRRAVGEYTGDDDTRQ